MTINVGEHSIDLKPFALTTAGWGIFGILIMLGFTPEPYLASAWFCGFFAVAALNLFFLVKTIAMTMHLMSHQGTEKRAASGIQIVFWGVLKLSALGVLIALVLKGENSGKVPMLAILMGLGTAALVPLVGGFIWSKKALLSDYRNARAS